MDNFDRDLLVRFVVAAEKIAIALDAQLKPGVVMADVVIDPKERTVDGWARVPAEVKNADQ